jgi:heme oxygenase
VFDDVTSRGGVGFCGEALSGLLPDDYHGPLVIALDSSVLVDLQEHGEEVLNRDVQMTEPKYKAEIEALGWLLDLWM